MAAELKKATWAARAEPRKPVQCVMLELPAPISTNQLWSTRSGGGLYSSKRYRAWLYEAGAVLNSQRPGLVAGPYALTLKVSSAWGGDLDNAVKAVSDLLQHHGVIENDRLAQRILIERADVPGVSVLVVSTAEHSQ